MNNFEEKVFNGSDDDLILYYCGKRIKNLSHSFGPYDRNTYLLYYIKEGKAVLNSNGTESEISDNGFFVNFPNSKNTYVSKKGMPWSIKWIVADGKIIEKHLSLLGITRENPYLKLTNSREVENIFDEMYDNFDKNSLSSKILCVSLLYKLFALLADKTNTHNSKNEYISRAQELIELHYSDKNFNVNMLSEMLGLHFNYLSVLFKKETGTSPIKAINDCRMLNACKMLRFTDRLISDIALSCGFSDEFYFSRAFKKKYGKSPKRYRDSEEYLT